MKKSHTHNTHVRVIKVEQLSVNLLQDLHSVNDGAIKLINQGNQIKTIDPRLESIKPTLTSSGTLDGPAAKLYTFWLAIL